MKVATAKASVHDGRVYCFCAPGYRKKFEAQPAAYLETTAKPLEQKESRHEPHD